MASSYPFVVLESVLLGLLGSFLSGLLKLKKSAGRPGTPSTPPQAANLCYFLSEAKYAATFAMSGSFSVPAIIFIVALARLPDL